MLFEDDIIYLRNNFDKLKILKLIKFGQCITFKSSLEQISSEISWISLYFKSLLISKFELVRM